MIFIISFWKTITCAIVVLILSAISGETVSKFGDFYIPYFDKIVHFGMYFTFTFLMINDFIRSYGTTYSIRQIMYICVIIAVVYGGSMEFIQSIPKIHRSSDFVDFLANTAGAFMAMITYKPLIQIINQLVALVIKPTKNYFL